VFPKASETRGTKDISLEVSIMNATVPYSLDSGMLARRLGELVGHERTVQVDFLLHLDEFDRRRAYLELGFGSLWDYCLRSLHLREGASGRRIGAMRVLRRFPKLEDALRDGRLCLSMASVLGQVLTDANLEELVARAAYCTKAEVDHLVASLQPRRAPKDGVRKLPVPARVAKSTASPDSTNDGPLPTAPAIAAPQPETVAPQPLVLAPPPVQAAPVGAAPCEPVRARPAEVRPVSENQWSLRVTIDSACKEELETLKALLSHKVPDGDLASVLREAIRCGVEKHGKRKGATPPARKRQAKVEAAEPRNRILAAVRREVWKRDGGSCTWKSEDGRRCGSRWQVEVDHIRPPLLGGTSAPDNLRLACRKHNLLHAEQVYGREHIDRFRPTTVTIARESDDAAWNAASAHPRTGAALLI
jgi:5-methylcytosine-specific restriction endonuclease McrA